MIRENKQMGTIVVKARLLKRSSAKTRMAVGVAKKLSNHLINCKARSKDKITKRFLGVLTILNAPVGLKDAKWIYGSEPGLRHSVLRYISSLPYSREVARTFLGLYDETEQYDDITRFAFASAIVNWQVPHSASGKAFANEIGDRLEKVSTPFEWLCRLVFLAKYGTADVVLKTVYDDRKYAREPFLARQRIAVMTRCLAIDPKGVEREWRNETAAGYPDSASVASNLLNIYSQPYPTKSKRLYSYLFPEKRQQPYPLPKFLLNCVVAYADSKSTLKRSEPISYITCPWYVHWLTEINSKWF